MRPRSAAVLACRVISILLGIQVVTQSVSVLIFTNAHLEGTGEFWAITGTTAVIAWFLWIAAVNLSTAMARGTPDELPASPRPTANMHAVALSIVGLVLLVEAIPALIAIAVSEAPGFGPFGPFGPLSIRGDLGLYDRTGAVVTNVVRIALGVLLIYGSSDLARAIARRYPEPEPPASPFPPEQP